MSGWNETMLGFRVEKKDEKLAEQLLKCLDVDTDKEIYEEIGILDYQNFKPTISGAIDEDQLLGNELDFWRGDRKYDMYGYADEEDEDDADEDDDEDDEEAESDSCINDLFCLANRLFAPAYVYVAHEDGNSVDDTYFRYEAILDPETDEKTESSCFYSYGDGINVDTDDPKEEGTEKRERSLSEKELNPEILDYLTKKAESLEFKELAEKLKTLKSNASLKKTDKQKKQDNNSLFKIKKGKLLDYKGKEKTVIIPDGVTVIGEEAFCELEKLEEVVIPEGVTAIEDYAFSGCTNLKTVSLPDSLVSIGESAFEECESLEDISIPEGVTRIGDSAFYGCTGLKAIVIPEGVTEIEGSLFCECENLSSIVLPRGITDIAENAFLGCTSLTEFKWPPKIKVINNSVFCCTGLTEFTIPDGITDIGSYAFSGCPLKQITIPESVTKIHAEAFINIPDLTLIVTKGSCADEYCKKRRFVEMILKEISFNEFKELFMVNSSYFGEMQYKNCIKNLVFYSSYYNNPESVRDAFELDYASFVECIKGTNTTMDEERYKKIIARINDFREAAWNDFEEVEGEAGKVRYVINQ